MIGKVSSFEEEDGTGTGRNEVRIKLSRGDLGSQFTCQAENEAIDQPLSTSVQVDVNRKSKLECTAFSLESGAETLHEYQIKMVCLSRKCQCFCSRLCPSSCCYPFCIKYSSSSRLLVDMVNLSKFRAHSYIFEYKMRTSLKKGFSYSTSLPNRSHWSWPTSRRWCHGKPNVSNLGSPTSCSHHLVQWIQTLFWTTCWSSCFTGKYTWLLDCVICCQDKSKITFVLTWSMHRDYQLLYLKLRRQLPVLSGKLFLALILLSLSSLESHFDLFFSPLCIARSIRTKSTILKSLHRNLRSSSQSSRYTSNPLLTNI